MPKRMIVIIIFLTVLFGSVFGWDILRGIFIKKFFASYQPPPVVITAAKAKAATWQPQLNAVGTLQAVNGVNISTEASGVITAIYFESGQVVAAGASLIKINDAVESADLENNLAALKLAQVNYQRMQNLSKQKAVSQSQLDTAQAQLTQAQAQVDKVKALVAQKNITAPFAGKVGIRQVNLGQFVSPGNVIVTLQALDPLFVNFFVPEQYLHELYVNQPVVIKVDTFAESTFTGKISAINATADTATHNILVQASIPNSSLQLYPGLFAQVHVALPAEKNVITLPQSAVDYSLFGDTIFVINHQGVDKNGKPILKVERRFVRVGDQFSNQVAIINGVRDGEEVVTSGQLKLNNGARVTIDEKTKM